MDPKEENKYGKGEESSSIEEQNRIMSCSKDFEHSEGQLNDADIIPGKNEWQNSDPRTNNFVKKESNDSKRDNRTGAQRNQSDSKSDNLSSQESDNLSQDPQNFALKLQTLFSKKYDLIKQMLHYKTSLEIDKLIEEDPFVCCLCILRSGFTGLEAGFLHSKDPKTTYESWEDAYEEDTIQRINLFKEKILTIINRIASVGKQEELLDLEEWKETINSLMILNYVQFRVLKYDYFTSDLLDKDSSISKIYNVNVGFQCYYLVDKLWKNNDLPSSNIVLENEYEGILRKYLRLGKYFFFSWRKCISQYILKCKSELSKIPSSQYKKTMNMTELQNRATTFFDLYTSKIEITMPDGVLQTKYFIILPEFQALMQWEKNQFWSTANLSNEITAKESFIDYSQHKIKELRYQNMLQSRVFIPRDVTKKYSWFTDAIMLIIFIMNIFVIFTLESQLDNNNKVEYTMKMNGISDSDSKTIMLCTSIIVIIMLFCQIACQTLIVLKPSNGNMKNCWSLTKLYMKNQKKLTARQTRYSNSRNIWSITYAFYPLVLGNFYPPLFLFALVSSIVFIPSVLDAISDISIPTQRVWPITLFGIVIFLCLSSFGYMILVKDFLEITEETKMAYSTFISIFFDQWYKGGVGSLLDENDLSAVIKKYDDGTQKYNIDVVCMIYQFIFYFAIVIVMLGIVTAIIIDKFGEGRTKREAIAEFQSSHCFICGKSSQDFEQFIKFQNFKRNEDSEEDKDKETFWEHCTFCHNIWDYFFYIGLLVAYDKDSTDPIDEHVKEQLRKGDISWMPSVHNTHREGTGANPEQDPVVNQSSNHKLEALEEKMDALGHKVDSLAKKLERHNKLH
ncbi:unnamed protein product [Moneuplotes crassus]|uniref:Uncharacterized protein n=1 Tax=Euplotes crassus TaxID=5936 RepID=A0AAD1Y638_EUPCR|nr:unnamed protein product [Moneuplotes crassus]